MWIRTTLKHFGIFKWNKIKYMDHGSWIMDNYSCEKREPRIMEKNLEVQVCLMRKEMERERTLLKITKDNDRCLERSVCYSSTKN